MADVVQITKYDYYLYSSRNADTADAAITLYSATGIVGAVFFDDSGAPLFPPTKSPAGTYGLHYRRNELADVIDMLRHESPVYMVYDGAKNTRLSTSKEPVGEAES